MSYFTGLCWLSPGGNSQIWTELYGKGGWYRPAGMLEMLYCRNASPPPLSSSLLSSCVTWLLSVWCSVRKCDCVGAGTKQRNTRACYRIKFLQRGGNTASLLTGWSGGNTQAAMDCLLGFKCLLLYFAGNCWKGSIPWTKLLTQFCVTVSLGAGRKLANPLICFFVLRLGLFDIGTGHRDKKACLEIELEMFYVKLYYLMIAWNHLRMFT